MKHHRTAIAIRLFGLLLLLTALAGVPLLLSPPGLLLAAQNATATTSAIVINEIFAHSDDSDAVELHNIGDTAIDISGWLLTDNTTRPLRDWARIPNGTSLPPGGYYVSWEKDRVNGNWNFGLSEAGETIYLLRPNPESGAPLLVESVRFGASPNGVSFVRYVDSAGRIHYPLQSGTPTLGATNRAPRLSAVIIEEIMHHPPSGEAEYIVIANITSVFVALHEFENPENTWKFVGQNQGGDNHDMFIFPPAMTLAPYERIILSETDPQELRRKLSIAPDVRVFQWVRGGLNNSGERIALMASQRAEIDGTVNHFVVDEVEYNYDPAQGVVWPNASGNGQALGRIAGWAFANDVVNWRAVAPLRTVAPRIYLPFVSSFEGNGE